MRVAFDAVTASNGPAPVDVAAGYIGGDTPHVWSHSEWASRPERWRLPIFVRSFPGDPVADGNAAKAWAEASNMPPGTVIALDLETLVDAAYVIAFDAQVQPYKTMIYGSASTVFRNPRPSAGYWGAAWNGVENVPPGWDGHQYQSTDNYDLSVFGDWVPLWDTQTPAPAPPVPVTNVAAAVLL